MSDLILISVAVALCLIIIFLGRKLQTASAKKNDAERRILFPVQGKLLDIETYQTALTIAQRQHATLVLTFLANVPQKLPLTAPLPLQGEKALQIFEDAEPLATREHVSLDLRVERGRTFRHALTNAIASEEPNQVVLVVDPEGKHSHPSPEDIAWALKTLPTEILIFRVAKLS